MKKKICLVAGDYRLDSYVAKNLNDLKLRVLFFPLFLLLIITTFLLIKGSFSIQAYTQMQKDLFLYLNVNLSKFPSIQFNLTQLGDVLVFLPFFTVFIIYAPKFWEYLLTPLLFSSIISNLLKKLFAVPRPAAIFENDSFVILGETLFGKTSLPSGHSIAAFTILTLVFCAFMPKKVPFKVAWFFFVLISGIIIVFTRVGVGAHYPLDVIIGSIVGCTSSFLGISLTKKFNPWGWIKNKKNYPLFMLLLSIWGGALIYKIITVNLMIFYFSLVALLITLFLIANIYVKKIA